MSTIRFQTQAEWSLIPGPAELTQPMNSQDLQDIGSFSPELIADSFLSFPGVRLLHPPKPSWFHWLARWDYGRDFMQIGMTLFDDEQQSWGGSPITADCSPDQMDALWSHLQAQHSGVWLHDRDCIVHTRDSFKKAMAG